MTLALGAFALILASTLIFFAENEAQPEVFSSIPAAFWWAITTLTTVGYGDAFPVTVGGKIFGGIFQVFGVLLLALPTGILASAFVQEMEDARRDGVPRTDAPPPHLPPLRTNHRGHLERATPGLAAKPRFTGSFGPGDP